MVQIKIDDTQYDLEGASDRVLQQYESLKSSAVEVESIKQRIAIAATARLNYEKELSARLVDKIASDVEIENSIELEGKWYDISLFAGEENVGVQSVRACDMRIANLKVDLAITDTAIKAYTKELKKYLELEKPTIN